MKSIREVLDSKKEFLDRHEAEMYAQESGEIIVYEYYPEGIFLKAPSFGFFTDHYSVNLSRLFPDDYKTVEGAFSQWHAGSISVPMRASQRTGLEHGMIMTVEDAILVFHQEVTFFNTKEELLQFLKNGNRLS